MTILVFDRSYKDFIEWRSTNLPRLNVDGTLVFVGNDINKFLSLNRNSFYIRNYGYSLTQKEEQLVIMLDLKEIKLVDSYIKFTK